MQYKFMSPDDIRNAIKENTPVVISIGNLEYHSGHLPVGTDGLIIEGCLKRLEKRRPELILLPEFYYGPSSFAVAGPECGSLSVDSMTVCRFAEELFTNLLQTGFKNIHGFVYHQSENFMQGMPLDLAFRFAGRRAIFAEEERKKGRGWWGNSSMKNYYDAPENNIFDHIMIHSLTNEKIEEEFSSDHAGIVETSAMMELYPGTVHMDKHIQSDWFAESSLQASAEFGKRYVSAIVDNMENLLFQR